MYESSLDRDLCVILVLCTVLFPIMPVLPPYYDEDLFWLLMPLHSLLRCILFFYFAISFMSFFFPWKINRYYTEKLILPLCLNAYFGLSYRSRRTLIFYIFFGIYSFEFFFSLRMIDKLMLGYFNSLLFTFSWTALSWTIFLHLCFR